MLDPKTRKVIISRDVNFDESKDWNWSQNLDEHNRVGSFTITLGEFGNHGIQVHEVRDKKNDEKR